MDKAVSAFKDKIKKGLWKIGIRRSSRLYQSLVRQCYTLGFIKFKHPDKLHLGCGGRVLPGWTNIDINNGDILLDVLKGLPVKDSSVNFIYHAHFIEHFDVERNLRIFKECFRVMSDEGCIRILFPDLTKHCQVYLNGDVNILHGYKADGTIVFEPEKFKYSVLSEWFNSGFYGYGHKFIYDFKTIEAIAKSAGFTMIYPREHGKSSFEELVNIDYYPNTDRLFSIVEIRK